MFLSYFLVSPFLSFYALMGSSVRGVARGVLRCPWPPLGRPFFEQTTYNIHVAKTALQFLGRNSHCWKAHCFRICFFVKYFRLRLLPLVNMRLHAAIIRLSPLIHEREQRYKPYIVGNPRIVTAPPPPPPLKNPGYAPECFVVESRVKGTNCSLVMSIHLLMNYLLCRV